MAGKKSLKVPKGKMGNFTFVVYVGGCGETAEEAWEDVLESVAMDGLGMMPDLKHITLDEVIDDGDGEDGKNDD